MLAFKGYLKKPSELGLSPAYRKKQVVHSVIKHLIALALLLAEKIQEGYQVLQSLLLPLVYR